MSDLPILDEAKEAIRQGQRGRAKDLLTRLLSTKKDDPEHWLLMSSVVDSQKERIYCLQTALKLDPDNQAARQGLTLLGVMSPDESLEPTLPIRRKWDVTLEQEELWGGTTDPAKTEGGKDPGLWAGTRPSKDRSRDLWR